MTTPADQQHESLTRFFQSPSGSLILPPPRPTLIRQDQWQGYQPGYGWHPPNSQPPPPVVASGDCTLSRSASFNQPERQPLFWADELERYNTVRALSPSSSLSASPSTDSEEDSSVHSQLDVDVDVDEDEDEDENNDDKKPVLPTHTVRLAFERERAPSPEPPDIYGEDSIIYETPTRGVQIPIQIELNSDEAPANPPLGSTHHGYTKAQLKLIKKMWSTRRQSWNLYEYRKQMWSNEAYDGIVRSPPPVSFHPTTHNSGISEYSTDRPTEAAFNPNIYPRMGHLHSRNDERYILIDQALHQIPVHAIYGTLLVHNLLFYGSGKFKLALPFGRGPSRLDRVVSSPASSISSNDSLSTISFRSDCGSNDDTLVEPPGLTMDVDPEDKTKEAADPPELRIPYDSNTVFPGQWKVLLEQMKCAAQEDGFTLPDSLLYLDLDQPLPKPASPLRRQPSPRISRVLDDQDVYMEVDDDYSVHCSYFAGNPNLNDGLSKTDLAVLGAHHNPTSMQSHKLLGIITIASWCNTTR
ncbi:hypothetical protein K474DRAFT_1675038 [Panus rudis PR-1116 ss-1]|nr:hypothetical protein K474DRAFT_1675038 [Panus rudis PR-1116 ss-1]